MLTFATFLKTDVFPAFYFYFNQCLYTVIKTLPDLHKLFSQIILPKII